MIEGSIEYLLYKLLDIFVLYFSLHTTWQFSKNADDTLLSAYMAIEESLKDAEKMHGTRNPSVNRKTGIRFAPSQSLPVTLNTIKKKERLLSFGSSAVKKNCEKILDTTWNVKRGVRKQQFTCRKGFGHEIFLDPLLNSTLRSCLLQTLCK